VETDKSALRALLRLEQEGRLSVADSETRIGHIRINSIHRFCRRCLQNLCLWRMLAIELSASFRSETGVRALSQHLDVGANDIADPAGFGVAEDFVDIAFLLAKTILQSFYCDVESDFVPKFETVGDGLRG
jgi:hypothetical protein